MSYEWKGKDGVNIICQDEFSGRWNQLVNLNRMEINWIGIFVLHEMKNRWRESFSRIQMSKSNIKNAKVEDRGYKLGWHL